MRIAGKRIRKSQLKRAGWLVIATVGTVSLVAMGLAPAFGVAGGGF